MHRYLCLVVCLAVTANAAPKCPSVDEAAGLAGEPGEMGAKLTPPLPVTWPPSGPPAVRYFDFRSEALPTGVVAYSLDSPSVEITVPLDGSPPKKRALKRTRLGRYERPVDRAKYDLGAASGVLLTVVCEDRMPNEAEAAKLREGYGPWLKEQSLITAWLSTNAGPFAAWINARPVPPPAPPGAKLTARIDGKAVVLSRDGKEVRFERAGLETSQLTVVPMRADGSEPALWVVVGQEGMLVRYANPPQVIYGTTYVGGRQGLFSTYTTVSLIDVDGDGFNDIVENSTTHDDTGTHPGERVVRRYDPLLGSYTVDEVLARRASWVNLNFDTRLEKLLAKELKAPAAQLRGRLELFSVPQPSAPVPDSLLARGSPPFVGGDAVYRVFTKKAGQKFGGHYHLAHVRYAKEPVIVSMIDLGELGFPMDGCGNRIEEFRREGEQLVAVWPIDNSNLVEQRVTFDGKNLIKPEKPPVKVADCGP